MNQVSELLKSKKVIACCGAGGVGKTTVSAALAIRAAREGRRVLVVTIDPSKRLAETLGVNQNAPDPVEISADRLEMAGITGSLSAWMLDPQLVSNRVVKNFSENPRDAAQLLQNRVYQNVTSMIAGMQEYTAVEALYGFVASDAYDLIILDTPPSRDALRFLDAPDRAAAFLDRRIFNLFIPGEGSMVRRVTTKLVEKVLDIAFGQSARLELQQFLSLFGNLFGYLNRNQGKMKEFFAGDDVGFILVTSPSSGAVQEARFFAKRAVDDLDLDLSGFVLNRSLAADASRSVAEIADASEPLASALHKLRALARVEQEKSQAHRALAEEIAGEAPARTWTCVLPNLGADASLLSGLVGLSDALVEELNLTPGERPEIGG